MWARIIEFMLGWWMIASPFIFRHPFDQSAWWWNDLLCGLALIVIPMLCYWPPLRRAHLLLIGLAVWMMGFGYFSAGSIDPPEVISPPALQNNLIIGFLLLMFAVIPSQASTPSRAWDESRLKF
ncbi:SPW repeat domain-containing protein [Rubinisphaera margarita]|uniref:SPW repeat domain-containing protein n=1 Tax=Rubinisphaera margarita TaxID=2909586 RepID=UPI001EE97494|nr:SPW repeat protein [Rubinisphaera margarita]MCG6158153.1 SPW repeat protein [Rubinisphaera margarita]